MMLGNIRKSDHVSVEKDCLAVNGLTSENVRMAIPKKTGFDLHTATRHGWGEE